MELKISYKGTPLFWILLLIVLNGIEKHMSGKIYAGAVTAFNRTKWN